MGIFTPFHPEISTGSLEEFGFHKIKRQVKSIYVNMITDFFMYSKRIHGLDISELNEVINVSGEKQKIFIERNFPYYTRKLPLITPVVTSIAERKAYKGIDNYLYPGVTVNPDGTRSGYDVYASMYNVDIRILVVTEANELRDQLIDLLLACFTNYYRGNYTYRDDSDNEFIITPSTSQVVSGNDSELNEENTTNLVFLGDISLKAFVEYHYKAYGEERYSTINNVVIDPDSGVKDFTDPTPSALNITTQALLPGVVGEPFYQTLLASGGASPYTWAADVNLPSSLSLSSLGVLTGTPLNIGDTTFIVSVTDSVGTAISKQFVFEVYEPLELGINNIDFTYLG